MILIPENEYLLGKQMVEISKQEAEEIIAHEKVFIKLLMKAKLNYKIELSKGTFKGKEQDLYRAEEVCLEIVKTVQSVSKGFVNYQKAKEKEEIEKIRKAQEEQDQIVIEKAISEVI